MAVLLVISIPLAIWYAKSLFDKIKITAYFISADFKGLNLKDIQDILASGQEKEIDAVLGLQVVNESNTPITFSGLKAKLYYVGTLIAQTGDVIANQKYTATANNVNAPLQVAVPVTVKLNQAGARLLLAKLTGQNPSVDYEIELSLMGIPVLRWFPIKDKFKW